MSELQTLDPNSENLYHRPPRFSGHVGTADNCSPNLPYHKGEITRAGPSHKYVTSCSRPLAGLCKLHFALSHHTTSHIDS